MPKVRVLQAYISQVQLLYNTSVEANSLNANASISTGFFIIYMPERPDYGYATSNVVAMTVIMNGPVLQISQKVQ